jgi:pimeloyl-ACP methyl ester carboxylesterase
MEIRTMKLETRLRDAETRLFAGCGLQPDESYLDLANSGVRLRVLSVGAGPPLVMFHGVTLAAAIWAPWMADLPGYRAHLVELPGHGLSGPFTYRSGAVRGHAVGLIDEVFDALDLPRAPVIAHSLGGMFALWHAADRPGRIASLVVIGEPAVALPGVRVRMPLSAMTVPILGPAMLRSPTPKPIFRQLLGQGLSPAAAADMSDELVEVLRMAVRRKGNARTVASLMHAINTFRRPRPDSVMSDEDLGRISVATIFCLGRSDPFLRPAEARPSVAKIRSAKLLEVDGGHGPWLDDPDTCATVVTDHLRATGFAPAFEVAS